jgi:hypothetical protein
VAQMWFWFVVGIAYVIIGIFTYLSARRLQLMDVHTLARYLADYWSDEDIDEMKREGSPLLLEKQKLANDGKITSNEWHQAIDFFSIPFQLEAKKKEQQNFNKAFQSIEDFAREFNKATEVNRRVLYAAAASFIIAAAISFAQALSFI